MKLGNRTRVRRGQPRGMRGESAFTLLEVLIASSAMLVASLGFTQALVSASRAQTMAREQTQALEACRRQIEVIKTETLRDRFREYNSAGSDDVDGNGRGPGPSFVVTGLSAADGDTDGIVGEVVFPTVSGAPTILREDLNMPELGLPLDLDSDGVIDATNHSSDYELLPILVRVRWRSAAGEAQVQMQCILGEDV